jgi:hypothetical protein
VVLITSAITRQTSTKWACIAKAAKTESLLTKLFSEDLKNTAKIPLQFF